MKPDPFPKPINDGSNAWPWVRDNSTLQPTLDLSQALPRISIIISSFNQGEFLELAIRSVLLQDYPDTELIVIDGGSRDNSLEIIQKYSSWISFWVSESDRGQSHAINKGFRMATGDIITFFSSDDVYFPGTFGDLAATWIENPQIGAIIGGFCFFDHLPISLHHYHAPYLGRPAPLDLTLGPPGLYRLHQVATFYTRNALDAVGRKVDEELKYVMDRELLYRVINKYPVVLRDIPYGAFRRHLASKSISAILPFAEEFARMHMLFLDGNPYHNALRHRTANIYRAHGCIRHARANPLSLVAIRSLLNALRWQPSLLVQLSYYSAWKKALFTPSTQ